MEPRKEPRYLASVLLVLVAAACGSDSTGPAGNSKPPVDTTPATTLRSLAQARSFLVGAAARTFSTDAERTQFNTVLAREFNLLTPENEMKHASTEPQHGVFQFAAADSLVALAERNNMKVRGHTLVWHNQNASWLTSGTWTQSQAITLMTDHISNVVGHFKGHILAWDVVNEPFNDDGSLRSTFWQQNVGDDYIERAFRAARAADSQAELILNDYSVEGIGPKSDAMYALVQKLRAAGVPIDGVGFQGHFIVGSLPTRESMASNIARFAALGMKVQFTEVDVRIKQPTTTEALLTQADNYRLIFDVCAASPACEMIVTWGVTDKYSWIPATFSGWGDPLLFDASYYKKPAYVAVASFLFGK